MFKRGLLMLAISVIAAVGADSKNIAFNAPVKWATYRNNAIQVQFVTDSTLYDKEILLTIKSIDGANRKTLTKKKVKVNSMGNKVDFPNVLQSKSNHYALEWTVKGTEAAGSVEPFAIATLSKETISDEIVLKSMNGSVLSIDGLLKEGGKSLKKVGSVDVSLMSNEQNCAILLKKSDKKVVFAFDPANSKDGFLAFSHRFVTVEGDSVSFSYEKKGVKEKEIIYTTSEWHGELKSGANSDYVAVIIPWSDLGVKYQSGRRLGFAILNEGETYPENAVKTLPATWKNIKIK